MIGSSIVLFVDAVFREDLQEDTDLERFKASTCFELSIATPRFARPTLCLDVTFTPWNGKRLPAYAASSICSFVRTDIVLKY